MVWFVCVAFGKRLLQIFEKTASSQASHFSRSSGFVFLTARSVEEEKGKMLPM